MDEDIQISQEALQNQISDPSTETKSLVRYTHTHTRLFVCERWTLQVRPASGFMPKIIQYIVDCHGQGQADLELEAR